MFPASDQLIFILQLSLFFAFCAACFSMASKSWIFAGAPIAAFAGFVVWNSGGYQGVGEYLLVVTVAGVLIAGAVWVFVLRFGLLPLTRQNRSKNYRNPDQVLYVFLAVVPALVLILYSFQRQIVPDASCSSEGVRLIIGAKEYFVRPEFRPRLEKEVFGLKMRRVLWYSNEVRRKENLKTICDWSDNGRKPVAFDVLWITPAAIKQDIADLCKEGSRYSELFCSRFAEVDYEKVQSIRLTKYPEELLSAYRSWFQQKDNPSVLTGGDMREGYVCLGIENTTSQVTCNAWRPVDEEVSVMASTLGIRGIAKADLLNKLRDAVEFTLTAISQ